MKNIIKLLFIISILFLYACKDKKLNNHYEINEYDPSLIIKANDIIYHNTTKESNIKERCGTPDGFVTYYNETILNNNECNFKGTYQYQFINDGIDVKINNKWMHFEKE